MKSAASILPVSYTHLDVYKRQVVDDVQQSFPVMMAKALGGDGFTTPIDPSEDEIYEWVRRAESYTLSLIHIYFFHYAVLF